MQYIDIRGCAKEAARKEKRILVCGSRDFNKGAYTEEQVFDKLDELRRTYLVHSNITVVNGWADGVDYAAAQWAESRKLPFLSVPAQWDMYGKIAGFYRNELMIALGKPDIVVVFPGGNGTKDMKRRAEEHRIEIIEIEFEST